MSGGTEYLATVTEAAEILGIHSDTAYELLRKGEFPVQVIRVGRLIKVPRAPLMRLVNGEEPAA